MTAAPLATVFNDISDGAEFIFNARESRAGTVSVGGLDEMSYLAGNHLLISGTAVLIALCIAVPIGLYLGHYRRAQFFAVGVANIGRAVPALVIIGLGIAYLGTGFTNIAFALTLLAIPPILINTYVGIAQVDRDVVDAARGQGLSEGQLMRSVELPLALTTIFGGLRLSTISVMATAIIAPAAGYDTLGTPIISFNVYGISGQYGAAMLIAFLTLIVDVGFAGLQRLVTPKGLKVASGGRRTLRSFPLARRSVQTP